MTFVFYRTSSSPLSFSCIQSSRRGVNTNNSASNHNSAPPIRDHINQATTNDNADVTNNEPDDDSDPYDDSVANEGEAEEDVDDDSRVGEENEETNEDEGTSDSSETNISNEIAQQTIVSCEMLVDLVYLRSLTKPTPCSFVRLP